MMSRMKSISSESFYNSTNNKAFEAKGNRRKKGNENAEPVKRTVKKSLSENCTPNAITSRNYNTVNENVYTNNFPANSYITNRESLNLINGFRGKSQHFSRNRKINNYKRNHSNRRIINELLVTDGEPRSPKTPANHKTVNMFGSSFEFKPKPILGCEDDSLNAKENCVNKRTPTKSVFQLNDAFNINNIRPQTPQTPKKAKTNDSEDFNTGKHLPLTPILANNSQIFQTPPKSNTIQRNVEPLSQNRFDVENDVDMSINDLNQNNLNTSNLDSDLHNENIDINQIDESSSVFDPNIPIGLKNLGNSCFMNAVIQCLSNTEEFVNFFKEKFDINKESKFGSSGELALDLKDLFGSMCFPSNCKSLEPKQFKETISRHLPGFFGCDQQDSHEFLVMLFEKLHADLNLSYNIISETSYSEDLSPDIASIKFWEQHIAKNNSIINHLFEGLLQHTLSCLSCNKTSITFEVFSCLSLPLTSCDSTLNECLEQFVNTERMTGEAAWECPDCKQKRDADKKISICKLPKILIIHLKRFCYDGICRRKLQTLIEFPTEDLSLTTLSSKELRYDLYGVVNHYGTLEGGHYTSYSKSMSRDQWYRYDDQDVSEISESKDMTKAAYILFYISK